MNEIIKAGDKLQYYRIEGKQRIYRSRDAISIVITIDTQLIKLNNCDASQGSLSIEGGISGNNIGYRHEDYLYHKLAPGSFHVVDNV